MSVSAASGHHVVGSVRSICESTILNDLPAAMVYVMTWQSGPILSTSQFMPSQQKSLAAIPDIQRGFLQQPGDIAVVSQLRDVDSRPVSSKTSLCWPNYAFAGDQFGCIGFESCSNAKSAHRHGGER